MSVLIFGGSGQLGSELKLQYGDNAVAISSKECDLRDANAVAGTLLAIQPRVIINAAAYTAVDKAEVDSEICLQVNSAAVSVMADVASELGSLLVQVSTDYVFGGTYEMRPHHEGMDIAPQGVYANSKAMGEQAARRGDKHLIVRTCGLYCRPEATLKRGRNFVETILSLASERDELSIVNDQWCTPTYVPELAKAMVFLVEQEVTGLFHVTNRGYTNWFEFSRHLLELSNECVNLRAISTSEYGAPAPRPSFSALDTDKYHDLGGPRMSDWREALLLFHELRNHKSLSLPTQTD